jgi:phage FluMu protein Com
MADKREGTSIRCPACGTWLIRVNYVGESEINCGNSRCKATLVVASRDGQTMVAVVSEKSKRT